MKALTVLLIIWSVVGMCYMWLRVGVELETEAIIDPADYHTFWHYVAYGPAWWAICLLFRILLFLLWLSSL